MSAEPSVFIRCVEHAIAFEPSLEMKRLLDKNRETFAQYVVRLLSYSVRDVSGEAWRAVHAAEQALRRPVPSRSREGCEVPSHETILRAGARRLEGEHS